ncbi:MAG: rod shape-determining protein MreC [Clostridiaceae bacterium]|nr:rod shape-determining protein MreC [Clostridiaceae bacterium]
MRRFWKSGLMLGFAAAALIVLGCGIYGLAAGKPSPLKNIALAAAQPVQKGCAAVAAWFASLGGYLDGVDALKAENEELRRTIAENENRIRRAEQLERENVELRALLGMEERYEGYDLLSAEVTGTETGSWGYRYLLDCGTADGVAAGQCVIVDEGVVGWIAEAGDHWCALEPLTSANLRAGGILTRSRAFGVLLGDYTLSRGERLMLAYLPDDPDAVVGDTVETSGAGGEWPQGLLVGTVESVKLSRDGIGVSAVVVPACDLTALSRVYVIRGFAVAE